MSQRRQPSSAIAPSGVDADLSRLRRAIDAVDRALLEQLNERARLVQEVGRLKRERSLPVYEAGRERDIVRSLAEANPGPFPDAALGPVFREIVSATRSLEEPLHVAYMGPEGTFSHQAALRQFGASARLVPTGSIAEALAAVERGRADLAIVPAENTTEGVVTQTLDLLAESDLGVCGELLLPVSHDLLTRDGRLDGVRHVASHPQPLAQCRGWLDRHLPGVERIETASTAAAAQLASGDPAVGAIAAASAAATYGLEPAAHAIEDRRDNATRFLVLGRQQPAPSGNDLTSVVFTVRKDQSGALHALLEPFARCGVNLVAIQARPLKGQPWEYLFFLDIQGHHDEPDVAKALAEASERALSHKLLGSYPRAEAPSPPRREFRA